MRSNVKTAVICFAGFLFMLGVAYMFPPLYNLFCKVTGFDGTTQVAFEPPKQILDREVEVIFTATTHKDLPWEFEPKQTSMTVKVGEVALAFIVQKIFLISQSKVWLFIMLTQIKWVDILTKFIVFVLTSKFCSLVRKWICLLHFSLIQIWIKKFYSMILIR